jgi:hypothetical protein
MASSKKIRSNSVDRILLALSIPLTRMVEPLPYLNAGGSWDEPP